MMPFFYPTSPIIHLKFMLFGDASICRILRNSHLSGFCIVCRLQTRNSTMTVQQFRYISQHKPNYSCEAGVRSSTIFSTASLMGFTLPSVEVPLHRVPLSNLRPVLPLRFVTAYQSCAFVVVVVFVVLFFVYIFVE